MVPPLNRTFDSHYRISLLDNLKLFLLTFGIVAHYELGLSISRRMHAWLGFCSGPMSFFSRGLSIFASRASHLKDQLFSGKNLFYTNIAISISLSGIGDVLEQHYEILQGDWEKWSPTRTRNMAVSGMSVGIVCHYWYRYLDRKMPGRTLGVVFKKVLVDQMVCSPLCIGMFFITLGILERNSWLELKQEIKDKAHRLYIAEWIVWPPAQIINFYFLPTRFRVLYDNTISLGYDVYTSQVKHDKPNASKKIE